MARTAEGTGSATVTWSQRCYIQRWKLGRDHNQQAALRIFANQTTCRLWSLQASIPRRGILQALCNFAKFRWQLLTVSWLGREPWAGSGVWRNKGNGQLKFFALLFTAWARACGGEAWGNAAPPGHCSLLWILRVYGVKSVTWKSGGKWNFSCIIDVMVVVSLHRRRSRGAVLPRQMARPVVRHQARAGRSGK